MEIWAKDPLTDFVKNFLVCLGPSEELPKKTNSLEIIRDEDFNIILHTYSHADDMPIRRNIPLGLVYSLDNRIELAGYVGSGTLIGISQFSTTSKHNSTNLDTATESKYKIHRVEYRASETQAEYTVDTIANLPDHYLWPDILSEKSSAQNEITFPGDAPIIIKSETPTLESFSRTCAKFTFGEHIAIIGTMKSDNVPKSKNPSYIYYKGSPNKDTREKIRASLSYTFGLPLIYLGSSFYQENGGVLGFDAVSPSTLGKRAWALASLPFSPVTTGRSNMLNGEIIQKTAQAFFNSYDTMNLRGFLFRLWHADVSPPHMKAAYYGAIIESIQKRALEKPGHDISRTILAKAEYRKASKILSRFIKKQGISPEAKELFLHKIQNGNTAPQRVVAERFYGSLGLTLGPMELNAWDKRNDAAHGNDQLSGAEIENIRATKILRVILGRIMTRMLATSTHYIDYYTLHHPFRNLNDAIPQD